jgi:hypothetical protein
MRLETEKEINGGEYFFCLSGAYSREEIHSDDCSKY